jgi:hypothetical protein
MNDSELCWGTAQRGDPLETMDLEHNNGMATSACSSTVPQVRVSARRSLSIPRTLGWLLSLSLLFLHGDATATQGVKNYPRVAQFANALGDYTDAQLDSLSWYDLLSIQSSPDGVRDIRDRNPDIELLWAWIPQNIVGWSETDTFWYPDTSWSLVRLSQFYAQQNDWYLRDTSGNRIPEWAGWAANWTRYCPLGTYGTSQGLTYADWLIQVAIPQIVNGNDEWEAWGPGSSSYQGFMFEVMADCVGSFNWRVYEFADPDQDGDADGVFASCASGGADDPLSVLMREVNDEWGPQFIDFIDDRLVVVLNNPNKYIVPEWKTELTGEKIESWLGPPHGDHHSWWNFFYGLRNAAETDPWEAGYFWSELHTGSTGVDEIDGWDHALLQVHLRPGMPPSDQQRRKRIGLATTMLGDGFFMYTKDQTWPYWQPEFEWDFGDPLDDYEIENHPGSTPTDSVYVRRFTKGMVEVNPNQGTVHGIPKLDARFTFWNPITDLVARSETGTTVRVDFTARNADAFHVRYSTSPITIGNWNQATPYGTRSKRRRVMQSRCSSPGCRGRERSISQCATRSTTISNTRYPTSSRPSLELRRAIAFPPTLSRTPASRT